jgi:hypothetical protein
VGDSGPLLGSQRAQRAEGDQWRCAFEPGRDREIGECLGAAGLAQAHAERSGDAGRHLAVRRGGWAGDRQDRQPVAVAGLEPRDGQVDVMLQIVRDRLGRDRHRAARRRVEQPLGDPRCNLERPFPVARRSGQQPEAAQRVAGIEERQHLVGRVPKALQQ